MFDFLFDPTMHLLSESDDELKRIWFTADTHFGHANIIKYCKRPYASLFEMDCDLINLWNERVGPDDDVFHLGDFCFGGLEEAQSYFKQLNGAIHILSVPWHHDSRWLYRAAVSRTWLRGKYREVAFLPAQAVLTSEYLKSAGSKYRRVIHLSHYPLYSWEGSFHGSWQLHGHVHNSPIQAVSPYHLDVGVDNPLCEYGPINLHTIKEYFQSKENTTS